MIEYDEEIADRFFFFFFIFLSVLDILVILKSTCYSNHYSHLVPSLKKSLFHEDFA